MENLQVFKNEEFGQVRTVTIDGEPWFVGKDVAVALGYKNPQEAIREHVDEEDKGVSKILTPGGRQKMPVINESGLYSLILSSKLPSAKKFKHWITSEVLPSIRKTGGYIAGQETLSDDELLAKAVLVAQNKIAEKNRLIAEQKEMIEEQSNVIERKDKQLEIQKPFVDFSLTVRDYYKLYSFEEAAKILSDNRIKIGRNNLMKLLRQHKILMDNKENRPYQRYMDLGLFKCKIVDKETHYGIRTYSVTRVTGKGLIFLNKKLREWMGLDKPDIDLDEFNRHQIQQKKHL